MHATALSRANVHHYSVSLIQMHLRNYSLQDKILNSMVTFDNCGYQVIISADRIVELEAIDAKST
jgi:hypothetical protein